MERLDQGDLTRIREHTETNMSRLGMEPRPPASQASTVAKAYSNQCCGSGSGIRCLFDPWIRDRFFPDPGSRIPNPYFWELSYNFLGKKLCNSLKIDPNFFLQHFKTKNNYNFGKFVATKKRYNIFFFTPLFSCCFGIRDPRSGMVKNQDPGSGINIPDPQHWV